MTSIVAPGPMSQTPSSQTSNKAAARGSRHDHGRTPSRIHHKRTIYLSPIVGWGLVVMCLALSIALIILYVKSQRNKGLFNVELNLDSLYARDNFLHLLWSSGPTFVMTIIVGFVLTPLALALYRLAPYAELAKGNARARDSILVNYADLGMLLRFWRAAKNKKWPLMALAIATFWGTLLDTAASGLIVPQTVTVNAPASIRITAPLGIAPSLDGTEDGLGNHIFLSSDQYLAAVLFAGGQQLYAPSAIPFSYLGQEGNWSITPFEIHPESELKNSSINATLTLETYGINTTANCHEATSIEFGNNGSVVATLNGCSFPFSAVTDANYTRWHFADSTRCNNATSDIAFNTFIYTIYSTSGFNNSDPSLFLVMFCQPTISIAKVRATLSVSQGVIGALVAPPVVLETFPRGSNTSDPHAAALLGPPLNGFAINGYDIAEPGSNPLLSRVSRANLTQQILYEGIYGAQLNFLGNSSFNATERPEAARLVSDFYQAYLNTFSSRVYYNTTANVTEPVSGTLALLSTRGVVSRVHTILLVTMLMLIALLLAFTLHVQAKVDSRALDLYQSTIFSHVSRVSARLHDLMTSMSGRDWSTVTTELGKLSFRLNEEGMVEEETGGSGETTREAE